MAMLLVAQLASKTPDGLQRGEDIYPSLRAAYAHYLGSGTISIELLLAGLHVAAYEYCQARLQESWLTIGACARIGYILRRGDLVAPTKGELSNEKPASAMWWGLVVLERFVPLERLSK
jgi:hypothetical protein